MNQGVRKWLATSALLAASALGVWGLGASSPGGVAQAAVPSAAAGPALHLTNGHVRRESIPPSKGPAPLTGPASPFNPLNPLDPPNWGPNERANTDPQSPNRAQQEPSIAVNPTNPLNIVAMAKDERAGSNTKQDWIYTSTDGGQTWINQQFPLVSPPSPYSSDPIVNFSDDGICYVTALPYGGSSADGIQVARSTDGGLTFSTGVHLPGTNGGSDKEWTWVDNFPSSPYYHNLYTAWMDFGQGSVISFNRSTDRGITWQNKVTVGSANQFPQPVVFPNGDVLVTYDGFGSVTGRRSTNGGVSFGGAQTISSINYPNCPPDNSGCGIWRLNAIPASGVDPTNGDSVIVWADGRDGTATTYYTRSTDNGATWSAAARLAPPGVNNTYQVEPWVTADEQGFWHAIWYDDRENPNTSIFNIYYSQSTDDGATWSQAVRITDHTSDLRIGIPSSYNLAAGDYINVTASQGNVYGVWTDTRSGTGEDIYVVRGTYSGGGTPTNTPTGTPPTATSTRTPTDTPSPTPTTCTNYVYATATATIEAGSTDTGNHCDDCVTQINLPFPVSFYGQSYSSANVSSNGNLQFTTSDNAYSNECPPTTFDHALLPFFDDLRTDTSNGGVYTSVSGSAPNRVFNIEWRATTYSGGNSVNFEIRLHEDGSEIEYVYGAGVDGVSASIGLIKDSGTFVCYPGSVSQGMELMWTLPPCGSPTVTPSSTNTPTITVSPTPPTPGPPTVTVTPIATPCVITFTDVLPTDYFYEAVTYLYCHHAISGYADNTFRPYNNTTRGQITKIVVLGLAMAIWTPEPSATPTFSDVPRTDTFFTYIETAAHYNIVSGYADGTFRPYNNVTRGQLVKIVVLAAIHQFGWVLRCPPTPTFSDVPVGSPFYCYVETAICHGIISGYNDGTFRPGNSATRGQIAKIVYQAALDPPDACAGTPTATATP